MVSAFLSYINTSVFIVGNQTEVVFLGIFNLSGMSNYICLLITVPVELSLFVLLFFKPRSSSQAGRLKVSILFSSTPLPLKGEFTQKWAPSFRLKHIWFSCFCWTWKEKCFVKCPSCSFLCSESEWGLCCWEIKGQQKYMSTCSVGPSLLKPYKGFKSF